MRVELSRIRRCVALSAACVLALAVTPALNVPTAAGQVADASTLRGVVPIRPEAWPAFFRLTPDGGLLLGYVDPTTSTTEVLGYDRFGTEVLRLSGLPGQAGDVVAATDGSFYLVLSDGRPDALACCATVVTRLAADGTVLAEARFGEPLFAYSPDLELGADGQLYLGLALEPLPVAAAQARQHDVGRASSRRHAQ